MKQLANVQDPKPGQIWFVRDTDNSWYLVTVHKIKGVLADIEYVDGTPERLNIKRHAKDIALAPEGTKLTKKTFTSRQVQDLTREDHEDEDADWLEVQHTDASPQDRLRYINKMWKHWNAELFQSKMKLPKILLYRQTTGKIRGLGLWVYYRATPEKNHMKISPRVFLAGAVVFKETLVHEMCHQWCSEVLGLVGEGHGPIWKATMRKAGLDPARTMKMDDAVALDDDEQEQRQHRLDVGEAAIKKYGVLTKPIPDLIVHMIDKKSQQLITGILACHVAGSGPTATWAVVFDPNGGAFKIASVNGMLNATEYDGWHYRSLAKFKPFENKVEQVKVHYEKKRRASYHLGGN